MSRGYRRVLAGALTLLPGCFSPTGSVPAVTDSEASATSTSSTGDAGTTGPPPGSSDATASTDSGDPTGTTLPDTPPSTGPEPTASSTGLTTGAPDPAQCGDGVIGGDEACDDGPDNGDDQPCRPDCSLARCGDGQVCAACQPAELCDDGNAIADDACGNDCQPTACSNGSVQPKEECDDGNQIAGDGCSPRCLLERQYVFLSSVKAAGAVTGLGAADLLCAGLAATKFNARRKFVAWLSVTGSSAASRIGVSPFPYLTPKGALIAANTQDLLDGSLAAPILETESGDVQPFSFACDGISGVWTGTDPAGALDPDTCADWTTSELQGRTGNFGLVDAGWTHACTLPCDSSLRLYCIEQAP